MSTGTGVLNRNAGAAKPRNRSTDRSRSHKAKTPPAATREFEQFAYGSNEGDHAAMDRIVSSYLATHRQATLGKTPLFDLMAWSNSRCSWPAGIPASIPAATAASVTPQTRASANQRSSRPQKQGEGETSDAPQATDDSKGKPRTRAAGA